MSPDHAREALPDRLQQKVSAVLGVPVEKLGRYSLPVLLEEVCDTALMCIDPGVEDSGPALPQLVQPAVKTVSAGLGPYRLRRYAHGRPLRVVLGASAHFPCGWFATEFEFLDVLTPESWRRWFAPGSVDALLAEHVWEHLTAEEGLRAAGLCHDYLRPGGHLRVAVPDGLHRDPNYVEAVKPGGTGAGAGDHKLLYTHASLSAVFTEAGFEVRLLEYFDEQGEFHSVDWDPQDGFVTRSRRFDPRNQDGQLNYTSIILDAIKRK